MIKTDRQLAKTRSQLELLRSALDSTPSASSGVHPDLLLAARSGLQEQINDLQQEVLEYEELRSGSFVPSFDALEDLHLNLIRARIALGLTQAELAMRLGVAVQQVQRYEATNYAGASLVRLQEVASALRPDFQRTEEPSIRDSAGVRAALRNLGLSRAVAQRIAPQDEWPGGFGDLLNRAAAAVGLRGNDLLRGVGLGPVPQPAFKMPAAADATNVVAYATYARVLAGAVAAGTVPAPERVSSSPDEIRAALDPTDSLGSLLAFCWANGVAVLPLADPGLFHAAYWEIEGRDVVILKQGNRSIERWAFDLAHELCHVIDHVSGRYPLPDGAIEDESQPTWSESPVEQRANRFAGRVLLGPNAEDMLTEAADEAGGAVHKLKIVVPRIAERHSVGVGALANHMAYRLASQGINWWGAAANLQDRDRDPWRVSREALFSHLDFSSLSPVQQDLLVQALAV